MDSKPIKFCQLIKSNRKILKGKKVKVVVGRDKGKGIGKKIEMMEIDIDKKSEIKKDIAIEMKIEEETEAEIENNIEIKCKICFSL